MDKVVDGLLVFDGDGEVSGFPGSYSDYREWAKENEANQAKEIKEKTATKSEKAKPEREKIRKLTFKEKQELESITKEIAELEDEKKLLESELSSGTLSSDDITKKSDRYSEIIKQLDVKGERWFELTEIAEG
jgi:ATP-binding cassette subfamily F protein uup